MSRDDQTRHGGVEMEPVSQTGNDSSAVDSKRRRALITASLLSVPTIMTVTARPSFAQSNTSGLGSPAVLGTTTEVQKAQQAQQAPQAPQGLGISGGGNTGGSQTPKNLRIR